MQPKLKELLIRKYPHRKLELDDTSIVVSATRQRNFTPTYFARTFIVIQRALTMYNFATDVMWRESNNDIDFQLFQIL